MRAVSDAEMATYLPRVESFAKRFAGLSGAEFDDLVQEGWLKVFLLLRDDEPVSNTAIKNAMRDYLRRCERWKRGRPASDSLMLDAGELTQLGRKTISWFTEEGNPVVSQHPVWDV